MRASYGAVEVEAREEAASGVTGDQWVAARQPETLSLMTSAAFPNSARIFLHTELGLDLDELLEFGLQRFLDGVERLLIRRP